MNRRQEYKYYVSEPHLAILRQSLNHLMSRDRQAVNQGRYTITTLYFDTPYHEDYTDKLGGILERSKYRLRIYNHDDACIKFETKSRIESTIFKTDAVLTREQATSLIDGDYEFLLKSSSSYLRNIYGIFVSKAYRPVTVVEYDREPYIFTHGNIRITFDLGLRTYIGNVNIFNLNSCSVPLLLNKEVLEVKFDHILPMSFKKALSEITAQRSAISKYALCMRYMNMSLGEETV